MKIAIYCPIKNELKHIDNWYDSCNQADYICVLDTGSTDGSLEKLRSLPKIQVTQAIISPWRFDDAFNMAMYTVPIDADVCIRLDLDERLQPGWRQELEQIWVDGATRLRYPYVWNWNPDGSPGRQWYSDRIHARSGYRWIGPTHEYLMCRTQEKLKWTDRVKIYQYPDVKEKKNDLSLLQEFVKEYPNDLRALAYLGREYFYCGDYQNSAKVYKKFVLRSDDKVEKGQAYLYIAQCEPDFAMEWIQQAQRVIPDHREPYLALSQYFYKLSNWTECLDYAKKALSITKHPMTYISTPEAWGARPYDLAAIAAWNLGLCKDAYEYGTTAVALDPNDVRLKNNLTIFKQKISSIE